MLCYYYKPEWVTTLYQVKVELNRGIYFKYGCYGIDKMTEQEELFSKFYNHEKILVSDMDISQLREHRNELSRIAFEAKARLVAADDETRERTAKSGKEWLVSNNDANVNVSDAINAVKTRAARLSKMDKIRNQLLSAGIDESTVKEMVRNLEKKATEKQVKTVTFTKPSNEISAVQVNVNTKYEPKEPFDPTKLNFGGK
jgi:hypothetical protein